MVELGIVIAVIGVLAAIILVGRGFVESARGGSAVQMVDTLRRAGRVYAERVNGGRDFAGLSLAGLTSSNLVAGVVVTPWGGTPEIVADPASTPPEWMRISFCVPDATLGDDVAAQLAKVGTVTRSAGACGCATCQIAVRTR